MILFLNCGVSRLWEFLYSTQKPIAMASSFFFATILVISSSFFASETIAVKLPFHPRDALPLLPRQLSWPILNSLNSAVDLLPTFVGTASPTNRSQEWKGACFYKNTAWMEFNNKTGSQFGGGTLHMKVYSENSIGLVLIVLLIFSGFWNLGIAFLDLYV